MNATSWQTIGILGALTLATTFHIQNASAAIAPLALPGGATDLFNGDWAYYDAQGGGNYAPGNTTNGDLYSLFAGGANNDVSVEVFPETTPTNSTPTSTFGQVIDLIRFYTAVSYRTNPTKVAVYYDFNSGNSDQNTASANPSSYGAQATITAVNGNAPVTVSGFTSMTGAYTNTAPMAGGDEYGSTEAYYVDLSVDIPATANGIMVDFGNSDANGMIINEIQGAYVSATPEPASLGILGIGSLVLMARRRRA